MKIAIMGTGGTGGFFGGCLARAGEDVTFIARGAHLQAIRQRGLRVESASAGHFTIYPAQAADSPAAVGPVDLVLFCVKSWDTDSAAEAIKPMVGPQTVVISVQNGVDSADRIAAAIGPGHVLGGLAQIETTIAEPGLIRHTSPSLRHLVFGELDGRISERAQAILATLQKGGFPVQLTTTTLAALWSKFIFICGWSGVCAVTRLPIGPIRSTPETWALVVQAMHEVEAVARANHVPLEGSVTEAMLNRLGAFGPNTLSSMARDLLRGNRLEVETLNGTAVRLGKQVGVPTPVNDFIYACLKPYADGVTR
ncbi:MAG: 2-dehydropantoate 2-reductase [Chloroflexi bacterium]|nr:2-dehydropantoate 2-reductase [Chloroflexota bacterium]